jgi:hypothetical protein
VGRDRDKQAWGEKCWLGPVGGFAKARLSSMTLRTKQDTQPAVDGRAIFQKRAWSKGGNGALERKKGGEEKKDDKENG